MAPARGRAGAGGGVMRLTRRGFCMAAAASALAAASGRARAAVPSTDRLVSIGGAVTEIVFALGAGEQVIAVDSTSYYPPEATQLPDVGYIRQLVAEPIIALDPSLVLLLEGAGPPTTIEQLRAAEVPLLVVPDDPSAGGIVEKIRVIAAAIGRESEGDALAKSIEAELTRLGEALSGAEDQPSVLFVLAASNGRLLAAGDDTAAAGIIKLAGGRNAVGNFNGYKPLSAEAAVSAAPDMLLFMDRTLDEIGGLDGIAARPELALTPAVQAGRVKAMDGLLLLGFGPRTPQAVRELAAALHPTLALP